MSPNEPAPNVGSEEKWSARALWIVFRTIINGPRIFRWVLALAFVIFPPIYLAQNPTDFTPLVDTLFSIFLFLLAFWIGSTKDSEIAAQKANDRWVPQAESVIFRLMTLHANVLRFAQVSRKNCSDAECELPELKEDGMRAVRIKMKTDCEASSQRLVDIAYQLEDAIEDWRRFVIANCQGDECQRIFEALQQRQQRLWSIVAEDDNCEGWGGNEKRQSSGSHSVLPR